MYPDEIDPENPPQIPKKKRRERKRKVPAPVPALCHNEADAVDACVGQSTDANPENSGVCTGRPSNGEVSNSTEGNGLGNWDEIDLGLCPQQHSHAEDLTGKIAPVSWDFSKLLAFTPTPEPDIGGFLPGTPTSSHSRDLTQFPPTLPARSALIHQTDINQFPPSQMFTPNQFNVGFSNGLRQNQFSPRLSGTFTPNHTTNINGFPPSLSGIEQEAILRSDPGLPEPIGEYPYGPGDDGIDYGVRLNVVNNELDGISSVQDTEDGTNVGGHHISGGQIAPGFAKEKLLHEKKKRTADDLAVAEADILPDTVKRVRRTKVRES